MTFCDSIQGQKEPKAVALNIKVYMQLNQPISVQENEILYASS